ncbi:MAG: outer membrane protein assembly factor BamB family protein [Planctomycetaceae bacterium]
MLRHSLAGLVFFLFWMGGRGAGAGEQDGAVADAGRWPHPRGPASGSGRSQEEMPESLGPPVWTHAAKSPIVAPPLVWDGIAFLLHGGAKGGSLTALDVETGGLLASASFKTAAAPFPAAWNRSVFLLEGGNKLQEYRLQGGRLAARWSFAAQGECGPPRIHAGEIYLTTSEGLLRLRAGARKAVWRAAGDYEGEPAVYGDHVYAIRRGQGGRRAFVAHDRARGELAAEVELPAPAKPARGGRVVVADQIAAVLLAPEAQGEWMLCDRALDAGKPTLKAARTEKLLCEPIARDKLLLAITAAGEWAILVTGQQSKHLLATKTERPDLVAGAGPATVLGGTVAMGTWAIDFSTHEVIWHLRDRKEYAPFHAGLRFGIVPADGLMLLVSADGKTLSAAGPEDFSR